MAEAEIELDLSELAIDSKLRDGSAAVEGERGEREIDELEALLAGAGEFAPLPDDGGLSYDEGREEEQLTMLRSMDQAQAHAHSKPTGQLAVVDRLYKWEQRREAKLARARKEEAMKALENEQKACTFSPRVSLPVSPTLAPWRAVARHVLLQAQTGAILEEEDGSVTGTPRAGGPASLLGSPSPRRGTGGDVLHRLEEWHLQREERRRQMIDEALEQTARECTFRPAISSKAQRSEGKVTALLRSIDEHEARYTASLTHGTSGADSSVNDRQVQALDSFFDRTQRANDMRRQRKQVPHADGSKFTGKRTKPVPPRISDFTGSHRAKRLPASPPPPGTPTSPPTVASKARSPSPGGGFVTIGQAYSLFASDVADTLHGLQEPSHARLSPERMSAIKGWTAVESGVRYRERLLDSHSREEPPPGTPPPPLPPVETAAPHVPAERASTAEQDDRYPLTYVLSADRGGEWKSGLMSQEVKQASSSRVAASRLLQGHDEAGTAASDSPPPPPVASGEAQSPTLGALRARMQALRAELEAEVDAVSRSSPQKPQPVGTPRTTVFIVPPPKVVSPSKAPGSGASTVPPATTRIEETHRAIQAKLATKRRESIATHLRRQHLGRSQPSPK
jgi:hypothetical protein